MRQLILGAVLSFLTFSAVAQQPTGEQQTLAACAPAAATMVGYAGCVAGGWTAGTIQACLADIGHCGHNNDVVKAVASLFGNTKQPRVDHPIWRLHNPSTHEHFYTPDCTEAIAVLGTGFEWEGFAFGLTPVNWPDAIVFNRYIAGSKHFYSVNYEKPDLTYEGPIGGMFPDNRSAFAPLYRLYNPATGDHLYTVKANERAIALQKDGYKDEGVAGYVRPDLGIKPCM